jgi:hypothetical protein
MNFMPALRIRILISNSCTRWRGIFKGISHGWGQADFSENLCASPINKEIPMGPLLAIFISLGSTFKATEKHYSLCFFVHAIKLVRFVGLPWD